jgi:hypothetical protein
MQATVCGKVKEESLYPALDATAELIDRVERLYFKERFIKQGDRNELKRLVSHSYIWIEDEVKLPHLIIGGITFEAMKK